MTWEEQFGQAHWKDKDVEEKMAQRSLLVIMNAMDGRKVNEDQRKAAEFVAAHKAWPVIKQPQTVNINVLRLEDLEAAKVKAGLAPKLIAPPKESE
jgi:hypothetical protein